MSYEKIEICFVLYGDGVNPEVITKALDLVPTYTETEDGNDLKNMFWVLGKEVINSEAANAALKQIIKLLYPRINLIQQVIKEHGLRCRFDYDIDYDTDEERKQNYGERTGPYINLTPDEMVFMSTIGATFLSEINVS